MKYAVLSSLGGELLIADDADYKNYEDFLKCPICNESVFLRKTHYRGSKRVAASFIHHKAIPEISHCELRVSRYTKRDIEAINSQARGQRLAKLRISLWKYLKTNLAMNLTHWSLFKKKLESFEAGCDLLNFAHAILDKNINFTVYDTLELVQGLYLKEDKNIRVQVEMGSRAKQFVKKVKPRWGLHYKITQEVLELFISSHEFKEIRHRLLCCLCFPTSLEAVDGLMDMEMETEAWRHRFLSYLTLEICIVFLSVDWIEIFKD